MSDDKSLEALMQSLDRYVVVNRCYLRPRFSMLDLSLEASVPQYMISKAINRHGGTNFSAWINRYRINHFLELVEKESVSGRGLHEIASRSGFVSKAAFINAFKKEKNATPGAYVKRIVATKDSGEPTTPSE